MQTAKIKIYLHLRRMLAGLLSEEDLLQNTYEELVHVVLETGRGLYELGVVAPGQLLALSGRHLTRPLQVHLVANL